MQSRRRRGAGGGSDLAIPNALPVSGSLELGSAKRFKREHEDGVYAKTRSHRGAESIEVFKLREEWQRLLLPSQGSVHTEGREAAALAAEAALPEVPPLYLGACRGSEASQQLLTRVLAATIADADWQELWVLLGQISKCVVGGCAVWPWWVRQALQAGGSGDVAVYVDLAAREARGGADAPLDVELPGEPVPPWSEGAVMKQEDEVVERGKEEHCTSTTLSKRLEEKWEQRFVTLAELAKAAGTPGPRHEDIEAARKQPWLEAAVAQALDAEPPALPAENQEHGALAQLKKMRCVGCNTPHPCQEWFEARDVDVYDEKGGPDRLGWYCAPGRGSLHRGVCRHCASEADGWCEGGGPGASINAETGVETGAEAALILLNECQAHRSKLMSWDVQDVVQYRMSPYYGCEQWLIQWDSETSTWEDEEALLDLESEWVQVDL